LKKREATRRSIRGKDVPTLYSSTTRTMEIQTASVAGPSGQPQTVDSASQPGPETESRDEDDWRPQYDDEDDMAVVPSSVPPPSSADVMVDRYDRHQREKNKENHIVAPKPKKSFIDPQVGAKRIDFSEEPEDTQPTSFQKPKALDKGKKRARDVEAEEENGDDDFEVDNRPIKEAHRKRPRTEPQRDESPTPMAASPSPEFSQHRQQRTRNVKSSQQPRDRQRSSEIKKTTRGRDLRLHAASSVATSDDNVSDYADVNEHEEEASDGGVNYRNVNTLAKRYVVSAKPYKPQARRQWTDQEVIRFIELVEEHGPSWAKIEKVGDPLLAGRTQINLKDKARNMKFDFVK
jgi:Myb-like DNA-binding domain